MVKVISALTYADSCFELFYLSRERGQLTLLSRVFTSNKLYAHSIFRRFQICHVVIPAAIVLTRNVFKRLAVVDQQNMTLLIEEREREREINR